jgi:hypothetical protein
MDLFRVRKLGFSAISYQSTQCSVQPQRGQNFSVSDNKPFHKLIGPPNEKWLRTNISGDSNSKSALFLQEMAGKKKSGNGDDLGKGSFFFLTAMQTTDEDGRLRRLP